MDQRKLLFVTENLLSSHGIDFRNWLVTDYNKDLVATVGIENNRLVFGVNIFYFSLLTDQSDWLRANNQYIDFALSASNIEYMHQIFFKDIIKTLQTNIDASLRPYRVSDLINTHGVRFDSDDYSNHMRVSINNDNTINQIANEPFGTTPGAIYFSYPFFKAILTNNNVAVADYPNCIFYFTNLDITYNAGRVVRTVSFKVKFPNGEIGYYDFSHNPPIGFTGLSSTTASLTTSFLTI